MSWIEIAAALLGLANVALIIGRSLWNYPFGIAMVVLYFFVFFDAKLYSDALLQIFFLIINLYGWWNWHRSQHDDGEVVVERIGWPARVAWLAGTLVAAALWGFAMHHLTDAAAPFVDATIAALSVSAQILMSLRKAESWVLWIAVDLIAVPLFYSRELYATAALYAVFLVLAVTGLIAWWRKLPQARPASA